jgi:adenosylcobyric acid synthase
LDHVKPETGGAIKIAVPRLSRIANFDDLDPLTHAHDVTLEIVQPGLPLPADADLILLPGTKSTIGDLDFLREQGWDIDILAHARQAKRVLGLCGGYQMLGRIVHDPEGFEGKPGSVEGLGLLDIETVLTRDKTLENVTARHVSSGETLTGYEIHLGRSEGPDCDRPFAEISNRKDGAISANGLIEGTYLHGIFSSDGFRAAYLAGLGAKAARSEAYDAMVDATLDALGAHMEGHVDLDLLLEIARSRNADATRREAI